MASYFTQVCTEITGTREDIEKLKTVFNLFAKFGEELGTWSEEDFRETGLNFNPERITLFRSIVDQSMGSIGVQTAVLEQEEEDDHVSLVISSDESIDIDATANIIQDWLREIGSDEPVQFEWANICSKPLVDGFGGGAIHITRDRIESMNTNEWMGNKLLEMKRAAEEELPGPA